MSIASLPQRLRRHGLLGSLKLVPKTVHFVARNALSPSARRLNAESLEFDRTYGTRTHGAIPLGALGATLEQSTQSRSYYQAVLPNRLHARLRQVPADLSEFTFIDFGAGMGRALLIASDYPFRSIIGVELLPSLADIAEQNLRKYRSPSQRCFSIELFRGDALTFDPPGGDTVYFLYNPFGPDVLRPLLRRIEQRHPASDRVFAIYEIPMHHAVFESSGSWETIAGEKEAWALYRRK